MSDIFFKMAFKKGDVTTTLNSRKSVKEKKLKVPNEESTDSIQVCKNKDQDIKESTTIKKRKITTKTQLQRSFSINRSANVINWQKAFAPKTVDDLVVHPKKLEELRKWFVLLKENPNNYHILLLSGPSGCSKLTAIELIAKENGYDTCEFDAGVEIDADLLMDEHITSNYENQSEKFFNFLLTTSHFQSLFSSNKRLMVVKEFPNTFLQSGGNEEFWTVLKKFKSRSNAPVVFIVADSNSKTLNLEYTLFPENVKSGFGIYTISMNPISISMMKKALNKICMIMSNNENDEMSFIQPSPEDINNIAIQAQGDIRTAVYNLQLLSQRRSQSLSVQNSKSNRGDKTQKLLPKTKLNEHISILHAVGRALYPKMELNSLTNRMELKHNPESIADQFLDQSLNFIELVHSNYLKHLTDVKGVAVVSDTLSMSNIFHKEYREAEELHKLSLHMVVRGAMVSNQNVSSGFRPIREYANKKFRNIQEDNFAKYIAQRAYLNGGHRVSMKDFFADFDILTSIIHPKNKEEDDEKQYQIQAPKTDERWALLFEKI